MTSPEREIRNRRIDLGITPSEVANRIGVSEMEYYDIESYDGEIEMSVKISVLKNIETVLEINMMNIVNHYFDPEILKKSYEYKDIQKEIRQISISYYDLSEATGLIEDECRRAVLNINIICDWPLFAFKGFCEYFFINPNDLFYHLKCTS